MGNHNVPRGGKSSMGAANASPGTPGYKGKHREGTGMIPLGNRQRAADEAKSDYERGA